MNQPLRILHLEDNPADCQLVHDMLKHEGIAAEISLATKRAEFTTKLEQQKRDLILADYRLPDWTGLDALKLVREKFPALPFILISGTIGELAAIESLKAGATDYVLKQNRERLPSAVRRAALSGEEQAVARICDLPATVSTLRGKVEFEVSEEGREHEVLDHLLRRATADTFRAHLGSTDLSGVLAAFEGGASVETGDLVPATDLLARIGEVPGLARIMERLGGKIGVSSQPGRGTAFTLQFQATDPPEAVPSPPQLTRTTTPLRILVVEANSHVRNPLVQILPAIGPTPP